MRPNLGAVFGWPIWIAPMTGGMTKTRPLSNRPWRKPKCDQPRPATRWTSTWLDVPCASVVPGIDVLGRQVMDTVHVHPNLLNSWKEIAGYLKCGVRTAQRRECRGLPVRRLHQSPRASVFADMREIDLWLHSTPMARKA